jgi:isocitrate/isopropylmalate dehydrogenase
MAGKTLKIAAIPGDGTGPEVTAEAMKVLKAVASLEGFTYDVETLDWGGDRYLKTGEIIPEGGLDLLRTKDAIFLGAIGHPQVAPGILEKGLLLDLRFKLDQYINLRPVCTAASAATSRRARPTRWRCSRRSTRGRAASGASAGPSSTRGSGTARRRRSRSSPRRTS